MNESIASLLEGPETPDWGAILDETLRTFDCPTGTLHAITDGTDILRIVAQRGIPDFLMPKVSAIPVGKGMAGIAAERREPVQVCNLQTDESGVVRPGAKDTRMEGALTVPIFRDGRVAGTLGVAKPVPYDFSADEIADLEVIAALIAPRLPH